MLQHDEIIVAKDGWLADALDRAIIADCIVALLLMLLLLVEERLQLRPVELPAVSLGRGRVALHRSDQLLLVLAR